MTDAAKARRVSANIIVCVIALEVEVRTGVLRFVG